MIGSNRNKDNAFRKVATGKSQTDFIYLGPEFKVERRDSLGQAAKDYTH